MTVRVKICGLKTAEAIETAQNSGAEFLGFIFAENSPRYISPAKAAGLAGLARIAKVAVVVDASDELLDEIAVSLKPDYIQLHGNETDARAEDIKNSYGVKLIKVLKPNTQPLKPQIYDFLMFDSPGGGTGRQFDYSGFKAPAQPWFLSGGLSPQNLKEAVAATGAKFLDVSSGVEKERGVKDLGLIKEFLKKAHEL